VVTLHWNCLCGVSVATTPPLAIDGYPEQALLNRVRGADGYLRRQLRLAITNCILQRLPRRHITKGLYVYRGFQSNIYKRPTKDSRRLSKLEYEIALMKEENPPTEEAKY
jgi:hypothetical protein